MNNIKCILLDIDNTLTNKEEEISKETSEFFSKINNDYLIVLVTGRTNMYAVEKSKKCNASPVVISDNGAVIYNYETDTMLYSRVFDKNTLSLIWSISQTYDINCAFNTLYKRYRSSKFMNENYLKNNNVGINDIDEINDEVTQVVLISNDEDNFSNCMESIRKINTIEVCNTGKEKDGRFFADLNIKGTSKGNAITELYKLFNMQKENSICFGDSGNDISMFESSGTKVAMKNGTDAIKSIADFITEYSNNENGVVEFLKKNL